MSGPEKRKQSEIEHGRRIVEHAEAIWKRDSLAGRRRLDHRFEDLHGYAGSLAGQSVLELGCGTGVWTEYLSRPSGSVTAVEISADLLHKAQSRLADPRVRFLQADAERLPFPEASFDLVCGLSVLHHLDLSKALAEAFRVLKPGGKIWFSEPNMLNPQIMIQKNIPLIKKWAGDTPDETAFFRWPLARRLRQARFHHIEVRPCDFLHPSLPDALVPAATVLARWCEQVPLLREIAGSLLIHARK